MSGDHVVLDDALLLEWLVGDLDTGGDQVATTGSWWFRLTRALLRSGDGVLARRMAAAPEDARRRLLEDVLQLPGTVAVLHPRQTVPVAAGLSAAHGLNLLAADALATAHVLGARLLVSAADDGPRLRATAASLGIAYRAVASSR